LHRYVPDAKASAVVEAEKRDALSQKFEGGIADISSKLEEHGNERLAQLKENEDLREHLNRLSERSKLQEEHYEKAKLTFDLERQLYEARLAEAGEKFKASEAHRAVGGLYKCRKHRV
jgi:Fic family protein